MRTCTNCQQPLTRRPQESEARFLGRTTCSRSCATLVAQKAKAGNHSEHPHAPCPICNGPVPRHLNEYHHAWHKRRACSDACRRAYRSRIMSKTSRSGPAEKSDWWTPIEPLTLPPWAFADNITPTKSKTNLPPRPTPYAHGYGSRSQEANYFNPNAGYY